MKLYVASSWRNAQQPAVIEALRAAGHECYDFRNPPHGRGGFAWSDIDARWQEWTPAEFRAALRHPVAVAGFMSDWEGMEWADAGVLVMPCGRSAHLEAGYFVGANKPLFILLEDGEPELMYDMATRLVLSVEELVDALAAGTYRRSRRVDPREAVVHSARAYRAAVADLDALGWSDGGRPQKEAAVRRALDELRDRVDFALRIPSTQPAMTDGAMLMALHLVEGGAS